MKNEKNIPSEFLKDCLADAVIRLLEEYPLNEIQVKQICDISGYHRSSWFRAFRSKHESVTYKMIRLWQVWAEAHGVTVRDEFTLDNADAFFQYNYEIRDTTRLLYRRGLAISANRLPPSSMLIIVKNRARRTKPPFSPTHSSVSCRSGLSATSRKAQPRWRTSSARHSRRRLLPQSVSFHLRRLVSLIVCCTFATLMCKR